MMDLDRMLERLNIATANGVELTAEETKVRDLLRMMRRVWDDRTLQARVDAALAAAAERRALREQSATVTFPSTPGADDDLVVFGHVVGDRATMRFDRDVGGKLRFNALVWEGARGEGVYRFSPHRLVHYVPRAVHDAIPDRIRSGIAFREALPSDIWRFVGGAAAFLPVRPADLFGRPTTHTPEQQTTATAAAIAKCREYIDDVEQVELLRTWRDNAGSAGEASGVLTAMLEKRLAELGADDVGGEAA